MKKIALSLLVIAASGAYAWNQASQAPADNPLDSTMLSSEVQPGVEPAAALTETAPAPQTAATPLVAAPLPQPRPSPRLEPAILTRAAMTIAANAGFVDGTYTGPAADAYYGLIQIQAVVQGGRLTGIKVLQYPSDRRTSVAINRQALPMLRDEAVAAQSASVDIISGATLTSEAFIRSLGGALRQAK